MNWQASEFWQFSLVCYQQQQQRFLQLQDEFQLNINLLLFALYADKQHEALTINQWQQMIVAIEQSNNILEQHREKRRSMKKGDQLQYKAMLEQELLLERKQQQHIINTANRLQTRPDDHPENIKSYSVAVGIVVNRALAEQLQLLTR